MRISIIAALGENRVMGANNQLPWHLPADLKYFKQLTLGKPILMGRKTFTSLGKALPGRTNLVLTHDQNFSAPEIKVVHSLEEALVQVQDQEEIMIIGGAQLFQQTLTQADRLYLTVIHHVFVGDTFFPSWSPEEWQEASRSDHQADEKNPYAYSFLVYDRIVNNK